MKNVRKSEKTRYVVLGVFTNTLKSKLIPATLQLKQAKMLSSKWP